MSKYYISAEKAYNIVDARSDQSVTLHFPYKIKFRKENGKMKKGKSISLSFLMKAITLSDLNHPETEDEPEPIDIKSIISCYLMGSSVKPKYEKIIKKYLFGLYVSEKEKQVIPDDIDIICFVNNNLDMSHIKSMTNWETEIRDSYYSEKRFGNFDISYYPAHRINESYNKDFLKHIREHGVCVMGKNIAKAKKYACWNHDTIKDTITCNIPRGQNLTEEEINEKMEEKETQRFDILDL
jgi:hypothetical protein